MLLEFDSGVSNVEPTENVVLVHSPMLTEKTDSQHRDICNHLGEGMYSWRLIHSNIQSGLRGHAIKEDFLVGIDSLCETCFPDVLFRVQRIRSICETRAFLLPSVFLVGFDSLYETCFPDSLYETCFPDSLCETRAFLLSSV
jgi:hypothetical protein